MVEKGQPSEDEIGVCQQVGHLLCLTASSLQKKGERIALGQLSETPVAFESNYRVVGLRCIGAKRGQVIRCE